MCDYLTLAELGEQLEARHGRAFRAGSRPWETSDPCPKCGAEYGSCAASGAHYLPPVRFSDYD